MPDQTIDAAKYIWSLLTLPLAWLWHRHNALADKIDSVIDRGSDLKADISELKAHSSNTKEQLDRISDAIIRIENRAAQRRSNDG